MAKKVVDTNVAVVANGREVNASSDCQESCIKLLMALHEDGQVLIDADGAILAEYGGRLHAAGQPGVGDLFYRHILDNRGNARAVGIVDINGPKAKPLQDSFVAGANRGFDPDDRVFALVAVVASAPVAVALDSDWFNHQAGLKACGVRIEYVCGQDAANKDATKRRPIAAKRPRDRAA